jgi:hypothetical protein
MLVDRSTFFLLTLFCLGIVTTATGNPQVPATEQELLEFRMSGQEFRDERSNWIDGIRSNRSKCVQGGLWP